MHSSIRKKIWFIAAATILIFFIFQLKQHPEAVEYYYSDMVYIGISYVLHTVLNRLPFSVGDIFYTLVIAVFVMVAFKLIWFLVLRRFIDAGNLALNLLLGLQVLIIVFYLFWGMNYFRPTAAERLSLQDSTYSKHDLIAVAGILIDSANAAKARISELDFQQGNEVIIENAVTAVRLLADGSENFQTFEPQVKPSLISYLLNYLGTAGYYNPFTAEAQFNAQMPVFLRPLTACHEMAHQMGYNREDEANFIGFLAGTASSDKLLKYSAYYHSVQEFMFEVMLRDTVAYQGLRARISPLVMNDFKTDRDFWLKYHGKAGILTGMFYDRYLKINNQPEGVRTYNRMIKLTMAWYKKKLKTGKFAPPAKKSINLYAPLPAQAAPFFWPSGL